jgi:hypothetical protein
MPMNRDALESKVFMAKMDVRAARAELRAAGENELAALLAEAEDRLIKVHDRLFDEKMKRRGAGGA